MVKFYACPRLFLITALAVAGGAWATPSLALELVPGGYGQAQEVTAPGVAVPDDRLAIDRGAEAGGVSLGFTPRHAAASGLAEDEATAAGPRFGFAVRGGAGTLDQLGLGDAPSQLNPGGHGGGGPDAALTVGGAMHWHDWSIGGGLGRADFLGTEVDLFSASLGYGRLSAEIAYGQSSDHQDEPRDVLMLSTDLAAAPWLTLESDLALGSRPDDAGSEDESVAVGRFGLRLNF